MKCDVGSEHDEDNADFKTRYNMHRLLLIQNQSVLEDEWDLSNMLMIYCLNNIHKWNLYMT